MARPEVPAVGDPAWARNAIDRFVLARLEAEGLQPGRPRRQAATAAAGHVRPDRPAADPGRDQRVPRRRSARCLGAGGRAAPRVAALRRALGPALAGRRPLCQLERPRREHRAPERVPLPRLGHRRVQRRQALRPVRARADCRRPAAGGRRRRAVLESRRDGVPDPRREGAGRAGRRQDGHRHRRRAGERHRPLVPRRARRLRPLPRSQVRPDPHRRLLRAGRHPALDQDDGGREPRRPVGRAAAGRRGDRRPLRGGAGVGGKRRRRRSTISSTSRTRTCGGRGGRPWPPISSRRRKPTRRGATTRRASAGGARRSPGSQAARA